MTRPSSTTAANAALIATCMLACGVMLYRISSVQTASATASVPYGLKAGDTIKLPKPISSSARYTLVMYVRSTCHFCTESMSFYQGLSQEHAAGAKWKWVVAAAEPVAAARAYLASHKVVPDDVLSVEPGVPTPTLVLVDQNGIIKKVWMGALDQLGQEEVRGALKGT
jgi:hypothetical protein